MSRRRIILGFFISVVSLTYSSPVFGMEEEEDVEASETVTSVPSPAATAPTSGKLVWEDQPGTQKAGEGMTNINESRGNWFFKQQIGKDARKLEERINKKVMAIIPLQEKYMGEQLKIDEEFNKFNVEYGFQGGEIDARLDVLLDQISQLEQTQSAHDEEEVVLLDELKKKKTEVDALKNDFEYLQKLDNALNHALSIMSSQITKATSYEDQASEYYEAIYDVLNDQAAEELFKKMQVLFDNITNIETYLTGEFSNYFKDTSKKIVDQINVVKDHIESLKKEGIALGQKMRDLQAKEDEELRLKEEQEREKKIKIKEKANRTILSPIFDVINGTWRAVRDSIGWIFSKIGNVFSWIFGPKAKKEVVHEVPQAPSAPEIIEEPETEEDSGAVATTGVTSEPSQAVQPVVTPPQQMSGTPEVSVSQPSAPSVQMPPQLVQPLQEPLTAVEVKTEIPGAVAPTLPTTPVIIEETPVVALTEPITSIPSAPTQTLVEVVPSVAPIVTPATTSIASVPVVEQSYAPRSVATEPAASITSTPTATPPVEVAPSVAVPVAPAPSASASNLATPAGQSDVSPASSETQPSPSSTITQTQQLVVPPVVTEQTASVVVPNA